MRRILLMLLASLAVAVSGALIVDDYQNIVDLFAFADPTGAFGSYFHLGGLLADIATIFVAICVFLPGWKGNLSAGLAATVFVPSVIETIAALPCFVGRPASLCGVGLVVVSYLAIPVVVGAAIAFVLASRSRAIWATGAAVGMAYAGLLAVAQAQLSPSAPAGCGRLDEVTKRSNCLEHFAERLHDESICRSIEFRTTRFTCLREIAIAKGRPRLCDEIKDDAPLAAYEMAASLYRDGCFQSLAYALPDRGLCDRIERAGLRTSCRANVH